MPKFQKKPVVIEAVQWTGVALGYEKPGWMPEISDTDPTFLRPRDVSCIGDKLYIGTLEGVLSASPGDWIIQGVAGELYPCKPTIFDATYQPVD